MKALKYLALFLFGLPAFAGGPPLPESSLEEWISWEKGVAERALVDAFQAPGAAPGAVIASPQQAGPNYFFHWVRDGALTMDVVRREAQRAGDSAQREHWESFLRDYTAFSRANQLANTLTGLGEPKFMVNGDPFTGDWARPQNDGPALRASTLIRWALDLLDRGQEAYVRAQLYNGDLPASTVIKADLEYVAQHWPEPSFDLWEEQKADHFYTRMVQWKALSEGAALAGRLGDSGAASWYRLQAQRLADTFLLFLAPNQVNAFVNWKEGVDFKKSGLDIAVILAVLHTGGGPVALGDARLRSTFEKLVAGFGALYPINQRKGIPGVALGRYPEDLYTGVDFAGGNPWVLSTLAGAEYSYRLAQEKIQRAQRNGGRGRAAALQLIRAGDSYFERLKYHANGDGTFSEQFDRNNGFMTSARELTWSYAAFLTAYWARVEALAGLESLRTKEQM